MAAAAVWQNRRMLRLGSCRYRIAGEGEMKMYLLVAGLCLLSACSQGISGVYADPAGITRYRFTPAGKVTIEAMGMVQETTYVREGDTLKVALQREGASLDFTIGQDGSLQGPLGVRLRKTGQ